jgi:glutathione peroxidase
MASAYDFSFETLRGQPFPLAELAGKPLLVVNTASKCGFTPQLKGLETVWETYGPKGLVVIGVPCNQFGGQEPGTADEISTFCEVNYGVKFTITSKVDVKGESAHPFFKWAAKEGGMLAAPKWNFFKYVVGKDGQLAKWFTSVAAPDGSAVTAAIESVL